jgi:hypothetical protein
MKIFKELKKLGYIHYSATTIEELDDLPLNNAERVSEQALVFKWFRDKYKYDSVINRTLFKPKTYHFGIFADKFYGSIEYNTYEEAELECLKKLIQIIKEK